MDAIALALATQAGVPQRTPVETLTALPSNTSAGAAAMLDGYIYVLGGSGTGATAGMFRRYNMSTGVWESRTARPAAGAGETGMELVAANGKLWAYNGTSTPGVIYAYDPVANTWTTKASGGFAAYTTSLSHRPTTNLLYTFGGFNGVSNQPEDRAYTYNMDTNVWASTNTGVFYQAAGPAWTKDGSAAYFVGQGSSYSLGERRRWTVGQGTSTVLLRNALSGGNWRRTVVPLGDGKTLFIQATAGDFGIVFDAENDDTTPASYFFNGQQLPDTVAVAADVNHLYAAGPTATFRRFSRYAGPALNSLLSYLATR